MSSRFCSSLFTQVMGIEYLPLWESITALLTVAAEYNLSLEPTYAAPGVAADASCFFNDISQCSHGVVSKILQHCLEVKVVGKELLLCWMADSTNLEMWQCNCWLEHNTHIYPYMGLNIQSSNLSFLSFDKVKAIASSTTGRLVARYTCPSSIGICHCYLCKEQRRKWASVENKSLFGPPWQRWLCFYSKWRTEGWV